MFPYQLTTPEEERREIEAMPNVATLLVHPEEEVDLYDIMREHGGLEVLLAEPILDEGTVFYIRCADEWEAEGLGRAWSSFRRFRRVLPPRGRRTSRP